MQGYEYYENGEHTCVQNEAVNSDTGEQDEDIFLNKYRDDSIVLHDYFQTPFIETPIATSNRQTMLCCSIFSQSFGFTTSN